MRISGYIFICCLLMKALKPVCVAQDAILSQFYSSPLFLNPAFAGADLDSRLVFNYRNQPFPDASNFSLVSAAIDGYVDDLSGGLGLMIMSDYQGGLLWKNQVNAVYSYHLQLTGNWHVNFGVQAGYYRWDINWDKLDFANPAQTPPEINRRNTIDFASGILFYNEKMYGGIAAHHLSRPKEGLFIDDERLPMKYTAHWGIMIEPRRNRRANTLLFEYFLSPQIIYQHQGRQNRINYGFYAGVEQFMAGVWYQQDLSRPNAFIFLIGLSREKYRLGYSFDYSFSGYSDISHSIHEISLSFNIINEDRRMERKVLRGVGF